MSSLWSSKRRGFLKMLPALAAAGSLRPNSLAAAYLAERREKHTAGSACGR
ncbi:MAG: hypothetical protein R2748_29560 [Bryobacterales bacterium]